MKLSAAKAIRTGSVLAAALLLSGCVGAPDTDPLTPPTAGESSPSAAPTEADPSAAPTETQPEAPENEPVEQAASCEWDIARLPVDNASAPGGQEGELAEAIVGSWQHTHYSEGSGFETIDNDIRFVFPSANELIYCQHVPGITDRAENQAAVELNGTEIVLPSPAPGYTALAWDNDSMLWLNKFDDSQYLLMRR